MSSGSKKLAAALAAVLGLTLLAPAAPAAADTPITLTGRGWGHGRGMGQWGAQGYAKDHGWNATQILNHFYGGTTAGGIDVNRLIDVRIIGQDARDLRVTSGVPFMVGTFGPVDAGRTVKAEWLPGNVYRLSIEFSPCGGDEVPDYHPIVPADWIFPTVQNPGNDINQMLTVCNADQLGNNISYRGILRVVFADAAKHTVNQVRMEDYLRGVVPRESPASWHTEALRAQSVAARSYAAAEARYSYAQTCDTISCQVYGGAGRSGAYIEAATTDAAIAGTAGVVCILNGAPARTEFSSSTGGYTAGGTFPAVPDEGDFTAGNPVHSWTANLSGDQIAAAYGLGTFQGLSVTARNGLGELGGRVTTIRINGTNGSVTRTGNQFRADFGLRSDWFAPIAAPQVRTWYLREMNTPGPPDHTVVFGGSADRPVVGDWDNNGSDTVGVFSGGKWFIRNDLDSGPPHANFAYGAPGYIPVTGNWTGGSEGIGVYVGGTWYLRNSATPARRS